MKRTIITQSMAEISECGRYRWWLRRSWTLWGEDGQRVPSKGVCCFVMLNPSTADAHEDDPTIRRCIEFARSWGYDTLSVRNLFAWRATDPRELRKCASPRGNRNHSELLAAATANLLVAAWGANVPFKQDSYVLTLWQQTFPGVPIYCLGTTKDGHPRHPLYVRGSQQPVLFREARE